MESFEINYLKGYTITPNTHQRDKSISLKAKGLLSQMFSLPDSWDYTLKGLAHCTAKNRYIQGISGWRLPNSDSDFESVPL